MTSELAARPKPVLGKPTRLAVTTHNIRLLEQKSALQRQQLEATWEALEAELTSKATMVKDKVESAQETIEKTDRTVKKHRWAFLAGSVALGLVVGRRRKYRALPVGPPAPALKTQAIAHPGFFRGVLTLVASVAARQVVASLSHKYLSSGD